MRGNARVCGHGLDLSVRRHDLYLRKTKAIYSGRGDHPAICYVLIKNSDDSIIAYGGWRSHDFTPVRCERLIIAPVNEGSQAGGAQLVIAFGAIQARTRNPPASTIRSMRPAPWFTSLTYMIVVRSGLSGCR